MDDAIQNKFRIDSELSSVNDKIQEKESMVDENTRNIKIAEKKVLETIWKSDNSKKREEVDNRVSGLMSEKQEAFSQFTKKLREDKLSEASVEERTSQIFEASQNALRAKAIAASSAEELKKTENFLIKKISDEGDERLKANMSKELEIIRGEMASKISEVEQSSLEAQEAVTEQSAAVETLKSKIRAYGNTINGRTATNELEALKKRIIENDRALVNEYKVVQGEYERLRKEVASYSEGTKEYMEAESKMMAMMNEINEKGYIERHEANKKALELAKS